MRAASIARTFGMVVLVAAGGHPRVARCEESAPLVALLGGAPGGSSTELYLARPGDRELGAPVASLPHLRAGVASGRVLPSGDGVLVVADRTPSRDLSFASELVLLRPGVGPVVLCDRVYHGTRPLITDDGRVFVERGAAGREPSAADIRAGRMRVDTLTIEEVTLDGRTRVVYSSRGYEDHLAGAFGDELVVYRVTPDGADLVAIDRASGKLRPLGAVPPFARDFSVDEHGRLVYLDRDIARASWTVERVDLRTLAREVLAHASSTASAPHAWPGGDVRFREDDPTAVLDLSPDRRWATALRFSPTGGMPAPLVLSTASGVELALPTAPGVRLRPAGFFGAAGAR